MQDLLRQIQQLDRQCLLPCLWRWIMLLLLLRQQGRVLKVVWKLKAPGLCICPADLMQNAFSPKILAPSWKKSKEIVIRWPCAFSCGQNHQSISVKPQALRLLPRRLCLLSRVHHRPSFFLSYLTAYSPLSSSKMKVPSEKGLPRALEFTLVHWELLPGAQKKQMTESPATV